VRATARRRLLAIWLQAPRLERAPCSPLPAALQAFDSFMANITGSWCCHMPGEVQHNNVSSTLNYTMSRLGPDSSAFARWHLRPPPPQQRPRVEVPQGLVQPGGLAMEHLQAALSAAGAAAAGAAQVQVPGPDDDPRNEGRDPDDPFVQIEGGGLHRNVG
jgi:hypothetical protein